MTTVDDLPDLVDLERALGLRGSLHDFVKMAWHLVEPGSPFVDGWHIGAICEHLEAVSAGQIRDLSIEIPPGCMKSLTASVFWHPWEWIRNPGTRFMVGSFDGSLTIRDARRALNIMESAWFRKRWGDRFTLPNVIADGDFANSAAGFRFSTSVGGKATGRHADIHLYDDFVKPLEATEHKLAEAWTWVTETMGSRFRDQTRGRRVGIAQRLHELDPPGRFVNELGFQQLRLPMRFEARHASVTYTKDGKPFGGDKRTEEGELLWPEHFPLEAVEKAERNLGTARAISAQLQQRPAPDEGVIFKKQHIQRYTARPARFDKIVQSWDMTFKDTKKSDYVAGQVWGKLGADFYLLRYVLARLDFPASVKAVEAMCKTEPKALAKLVEDKANGPAVIASLQKKIPGLIAVNPQGGKVARANAVSPLFEAGNVHLPIGQLPDAEKMDAFITSLTSFPFAAHDDDVDCATQALTYLSSGGSYASTLHAAMAKVREKQGQGRRVT